MADEIRINRAPSSQPAVAIAPEEQAVSTKSSKWPWIVLGVVVLAIIVLGVLFRDKLFKKSSTTAVKSSGYQAVFLTNSQVYFGKISKSDGDYATLQDIYYLQVGPQQGSGTEASSTGQSISLVKLGNELHGPVDEMHISRSQILFYEDLKEDGQVVKAIMQDKATKK